MEFDPTIFGMTIGRIIETYSAAVRVWASPLFRVGALGMLFLLLRYQNRFRRAFALYFWINDLWLFGAVGIYASIELFRQGGPVYFAMYSATPVLLLVILLLLYQEGRQPRSDFAFPETPLWRWLIAVPMLLWAFFYPNWRFDGAGFDWNPAQLVTGNFGLMGCPVTLFALSLLFLRYPRVHQPLFRVLTLYAVLLGGAMVAVGYRTDLPFFAMGLICLALMLGTRMMNGSMRSSTSASAGK
jgi:hypothetical protein